MAYVLRSDPWLPALDEHDADLAGALITSEREAAFLTAMNGGALGGRAR